MNVRVVGTGSLLLALLLERFAYYGFRAQFLQVLVARGVPQAEAAAQYATFTSVVLMLPIVFAGLAVLAPRVWMAPVGALLALGGYLLAVSGAQVSFPISLMLIAGGVAMMKVTIVCAAADFVDSARARTVVGTLGYGLINLGAMVAPFITGAAGAERFSIAPVVVSVVLVLLCGGALVLALVAPKAPASAEPLPAGLLGVLLLIPMSGFLWLMVEMQPWNLDLPTWVPMVNPILIIPASLALGLGLGVVPARALPWSILAVLLLSLLLTAFGGVGVKSRDISLVVGVQVVLTLAEAGLGMLAFALAIGSTPPRFAPLAVALISSSAVVVNFLASRPDEVRWPVLLALGAVSVICLAVFAVFFRTTLGLLGRPVEVSAQGH